MKTKWLVLLGILGIVKVASADLTVVQDLGGAPLSNYVDTSQIPNAQAMQAAFDNQKSALQVNSINTDSLLLPQPQTEFSPGPVTRHQLPTNLPMSFFLMGGDEQSIKWAKDKADYLKSIHAQGFVVDVTSTDQIKNIETETGLSLVPGNVNGLSTILGTTHYPLLVNQGWVSQ